ncbi:hypothetical protein O6P37_21735 [Mycobacterium sp. CPCC 205372]|jgi:hypothetical protein|uniref:Uncharacterized protein n=2 Tax=Mycobacteriaceae TaxID=1762 RepID=A0ABT8UQB6_9MYCO|nr:MULTISPECIES: hypothetical protein [Mycobacteriaceae]MCZ8381497.1 hypothetical protein [Mycobacterium hippophais]MDO3639341.1 hypothetical protein [Mycolicibacterium arseniciresistens]
MTAPEPTPQQDDGAGDLADQEVPPVAPAYSTPPPDAPGTAESQAPEGDQ